jgi:hypothetical protein
MATWSKTAKLEPTWSKEALSSVSWHPYTSYKFLLLETGDYLLLETGDKIIISGTDISERETPTWSKQAKPS